MANSILEEEAGDNGPQLTLRVKCKLSQNITLRDISSLKKVEDFLKDLSKLTNIPHDKMALLRGFPPKRISYDPSMTIQAIGIINQDTIIVELDTTGLPGCLNLLDSNTAVTDPASITASDLGSNLVEPSCPKDFPPPPPSIQQQLNPVHTSKGTSHTNITSKDLSLPPVVASGESYGKVTLGSAGGNVPLGSAGVVVRKVVPSDNSCLFSAVTFCMTGAEGASSEDLRELIATTVLTDPVKYNEGFLGRKNLEYVEWICHLDSWGGGIELSILSENYGVEINVMDTQHMRINRFGEDQEYSSRIFLIYDGIHYDALYLECYDGSRIVTIFPTSDVSVYDQVMDLGRQANASRLYTDVQNFTLRCQVCNACFRGQAEAQIHAKETKHTAFAEYN